MKEEREKKSYKLNLKIDKQDIIFIIIISLIVILSFFSKDIEKERNEEILNYEGKSIGITSSFKEVKYGTNLKYYFYNNNKRYVSEIKVNFSCNENNLKKFFAVVFDKKNPENSYIYLNEEIQPDSITLTKAGFKYVTYYEHDIPTNTYIKKYKWE
jgi:hypothetical protein